MGILVVSECIQLEDIDPQLRTALWLFAVSIPLNAVNIVLRSINKGIFLEHTGWGFAYFGLVLRYSCSEG
jgi:hypothetical protein